MPCPASPEPDGFHRYQLQPSGTVYVSACVHCGAARTYRPFEAPTTAYAATQRRALAASNAAKRAKREAAE